MGCWEIPERLALIDSDGVHHDAHIVAIDLSGTTWPCCSYPSAKGVTPPCRLASEPPQAGDDMYLYGSPMFRPGMMQRGMAAHDGTAYEYYPESEFLRRAGVCLGLGPAGHLGRALAQ